MRTESLKKQKIDLESKLAELDKAIDLFSRKQVFVKMDAWLIEIKEETLNVR